MDTGSGRSASGTFASAGDFYNTPGVLGPPGSTTIGGTVSGAGNLTLNDVAAQDVVIQNYTGDLLYSADVFGSPITVNATDAGQGSLSLFGTIGGASRPVKWHLFGSFGACLVITAKHERDRDNDDDDDDRDDDCNHD